QLWLDYRIEGVSTLVPAAAAHEYGGVVEPIDFRVLPGRSLLSVMRGSLLYDTRDEPWLTNEGWLARADVEVAAQPLGSDYSFQKVDVQASRWWRLGNDHVFK